MPTFLTIAVPTKDYNEMIESVSKIKLSKRKAWKSCAIETTGQKTNVYYSSEPLVVRPEVKTHFYKFASQTINWANKINRTVFKIKDVEVFPIISLDMERFLKETADMHIVIDGHDETDNDVDMINNMLELCAQNATGNHHRNHNISIPTKAGEPCRA